MTAPRVRVGIVSWNTAALLDRCLAALPAALDGLDADVVVVDNGSTDGSADAAARHPSITVRRNVINSGYASAMNQALTAALPGHGGAEAEVLIALNPDTEPPAGSLKALVERLLAEPELGLVGPRLLNLDGSVQHSAYRFPSLRLAAIVGLLPRAVLGHGVGARWWLEGFASHDRSSDVDWLVGAVHVIRRSALDGEDPYGERWFMYVEDLDLCWRLARRGWRRRLEAEVCVPHAGNASGAIAWGHERRSRWTAASYDWFEQTHGAAATRVWAALNLVSALRWLVQLTARSTVQGLRGRRRAGAANEEDVRSDLVRLMGVHVRALLRGPSLPEEPSR